MTIERDLTHIIEAYLDPGVDRLPERSYASVRAATERTQQRIPVGPWSAPVIMPGRRPMLAVAAVALAVTIAFGFLPGMPGFGTGASPSPTTTATATAAPTPIPLPSANPYPGAPLEPGTYVAGLAGYRGWPQMRLTVPAGWYSGDGIVFNGPNDGTSATVMLELRQFVDQVNADPCHWKANVWQSMPTARELADALANQSGMHVTAPRAVSLGGTPATLVETSIPADLASHLCDRRRLQFLNRNYDAEYPPAPGDTLWFYVVDAGHPVIVVGHALASASARDVAALQDVIDSIRFDP